MSGLVFIGVLSLLVVVHEFGHFLMARLVGVRVDKFSIGFGPVIYGQRFGETEFCISLLPLGGFVKLAGENAEESKGLDWEFQSKALWQKFLIVFAGPFMNAFLAFVIFFTIFLVGQPTLANQIGKVMENTPAKAAGLLEGDRIIAINQEKILLWEDILKRIRRGEEKLLLEIDRKSQRLSIEVSPQMLEHKNLFGATTKSPFLGIAPSNEMVYIKSGFFKAIYLGLERVATLTALIFYSLGLMVTGALSFKDSVTGPIGIFFMTQEAAKMGIVYLFYFTGSLSVSLFVLNLLPIPVLDGGHVLFILIERLKGSPLKESVKEKMTQGGLIALLVLMAFVIFQDIHRFSIIENLMGLFKR